MGSSLRAPLVIAALVLASCTSVSDGDFASSYCRGQGIGEGTAQFTRCVENKRFKMERERAVRESFRYSP